MQISPAIAQTAVELKCTQNKYQATGNNVLFRRPGNRIESNFKIRIYHVCEDEVAQCVSADRNGQDHH